MNIASKMTAYRNALPYDARVEYLEGSGSQYINTNVLAYEDLVCKVRNFTALRYNQWYGFVGLDDVDLASNGRRWMFRFGAESASIGIFSGTHANEGGRFLNFYIPYSANETLPEITVRRTGIECDGRVASADNILRQYEVSSYPVFLFGINQKGSIWRGCPCRIGGATFKRGGETLADFIAVRVGSVGYMYDRVSKRLFANSGAGAFKLGPDRTSVGGGAINA